MRYETLDVQSEGHVTRVILNRPDELNALNTQLMEEIEAVSRGFLNDEKTRVVVFSGAGKHFSAGADLKQPATPDDSMVVRRRKSGLGARMINAVSNALDQAVMHMDTDQNILTTLTDDRAEGINAFFERRDPKFTGR
jgi:enoyl-CoA hydratase/carnithine racemase